MKDFFHSGDLGDIISALPAIRALGGGTLTIGPAANTGQRTPMTPELFNVIAPLVGVQDYITDVSYGRVLPTMFNLSAFRRDSAWKGPPENLAEWHARYAGLDSIDLSPWLTMPSPNAAASGKIIFARSARQHNRHFPWQKIVDQNLNVLFIGTEQELRDFEKYVGRREIPFAATTNLLEAGRLIAAADYGFYNSSAPFWVAAGLGSRLVQEVPPVENIARVNQPGMIYLQTALDVGRYFTPKADPFFDTRVILLTATGAENKRTEFAQGTWGGAEIHRLNLLRNAADIGCDRGCYYVKDVMDMSLVMSGDVFVYVNNDIALVENWKEHVLPAVKKYGCAFSNRLNIPSFLPMNFHEVNSGTAYCGADLFAFTPEWWKKQRDSFPDVVLGYEGWDFVMQWLMLRSGFQRLPTLCYHENHASFWSRPENLELHPAQKICRERLITWARNNGAEKYLFAPHGFLFKSMMVFDKP